jgi:hypothetical protein
MCIVKKDVYSLQIPALYNVYQQDLLQIISNIRTNSPYYALKMPIRAFIHFRSFLARHKRLENEHQRGMKYPMPKLSEVRTTRMFFISW